VNDDSKDLIWLVRFVWSHRRIYATVMVCSAVILLAVSFLIPKRYSASTHFIVKSDNSVNFENQAMMNGGLAAVGLKNPNDVYLGILRSRHVANRLIDKFALMSKFNVKTRDAARKQLNNAVNIVYLDGNIIEIEVENTSPTLSAQIADEYVIQLQDTLTDMSHQAILYKTKLLDEEIGRAWLAFREAEHSFVKFQQRNGLLPIESQVVALSNTMTTLQTQIAQKKIELSVVSRQTTPDNPERQKLEYELSGLQSELTQLIQSNPKPSKPIISLDSVPQATAMSVDKSRDYQLLNQIYGSLSRQYELVKIDRDNLNRSIQVIDYAEIPEKASFPKKSMILGIGLLLSFVALTGILLLNQYNRVSKS